MPIWARIRQNRAGLRSTANRRSATIHSPTDESVMGGRQATNASLPECTDRRIPRRHREGGGYAPRGPARVLRPCGLPGQRGEPSWRRRAMACRPVALGAAVAGPAWLKWCRSRCRGHVDAVLAAPPGDDLADAAGGNPAQMLACRLLFRRKEQRGVTCRAPGARFNGPAAVATAGASARLVNAGGNSVAEVKARAGAGVHPPRAVTPVPGCRHPGRQSRADHQFPSGSPGSAAELALQPRSSAAG